MVSPISSNRCAELRLLSSRIVVIDAVRPMLSDQYELETNMSLGRAP